MERNTTRAPASYCGILLALLPLAGCTPEKAEALVTAIKAFEAQSTEALNAYESLFRDYRALKTESEEQLFNQAYAFIEKNGAGGATFETAVRNVGTLDAQKSVKKIELDFVQLRSTYALLSSVYEALPQGSFLAAEYVPCGQMAVAKLTKQLTNFASDVDASPLYPNSLRQDFAEFRRAVGLGASQKERAKYQFAQFYGGVAAYEEKHANAIRLTLAAVEQGRKLNALLAKYNDVTISNVLGVIQYGFSFAGTLKGVDVSKASDSLKAVKAEMESEDYWKRVESIPLASVAECKMQPTKGG